MEYLRAFFAGRVGLGRLRSLLIISGAFGVFRTQPVREIDGYSTETITEDLELVVRLHRYLAREDRDIPSSSSRNRQSGPRSRGRCGSCTASAVAGTGACWNRSCCTAT